MALIKPQIDGGREGTVTVYDRNGYPHTLSQSYASKMVTNNGWTYSQPKAGDAVLPSMKESGGYWSTVNAVSIGMGSNNTATIPMYAITGSSPSQFMVSEYWASQARADFMDSLKGKYGLDADVGEALSGLDASVVNEDKIASALEDFDPSPYFAAGPDGTIFVIADEDLVTNLMKRGLTEKEANAAARQIQAAFGARPLGEGVPSGAGEENPYDYLFGGGGGGGGGSRAVGPVYVPPDRRAVEEMVRGQLISKLGKIDAAYVDNITDAYMRDHKRAWEGESIDPNMTVLEEVRNTEDYKKIHQLRPDSIDENSWVSSQEAAFLQGGGRVSASQDRARDLAAAGATPDARNAQLSEFSQGFTTNGFFNRMKKAADNVASRVA